MILSDKIQQLYRKSVKKNRKIVIFKKWQFGRDRSEKCFSAGNTSNEVSKTSLNHYTHIWHHFTSLWFQVKKIFFSSQKMLIFKKGDFWLIVLFANLWCYILTLMWVYTYLLGFFTLLIRGHILPSSLVSMVILEPVVIFETHFFHVFSR